MEEEERRRLELENFLFEQESKLSEEERKRLDSEVNKKTPQNLYLTN